MHYYFAHSLFGWAIKDSASRYLYANPLACKYFNITPQQIPGCIDTDLIPDVGNFYHHILKDDQKILTTGRMSTVIKTFRYGGNDHLKSFIVEKRPWHIEDGTNGIACTYMEISTLYLATFLNQHDRKYFVFTRPTTRFTEKEWEVILLLFCGVQNHMMTEILGIKPSSLRNRLTHCYNKAGVTNNPALIKYCQSNGWDNYIPPFFLKRGHVPLSLQ